MSAPDPGGADTDVTGVDSSGELDAGAFAPWLHQIQAAIRGEQASDVPCGSCTACCSSSQFVHIGPDERDALAHIPKALLFPAPRMPKGHVLMGYDERGRCPMLVDQGCTIYAHRPRTCRTYDCRIFPATGTGPDDPSKVLIDRQAIRWRFCLGSAEDEVLSGALRAAAAFLRNRVQELPDGLAPMTGTQRAVMAIDIHESFLTRDAAGDSVLAEPTPDEVAAAIRRRLS